MGSKCAPDSPLLNDKLNGLVALTRELDANLEYLHFSWLEIFNSLHSQHDAQT